MRRATTTTSTCTGGAKWICTGFTAVSTTCPAMEVTFQGIKQKDYNALTGVTAKWSDGYFINYKAFVTALAFTGDSTNTYSNFGEMGGYQIAFGNALTKTAGAMGGYIVYADYTNNTPTDNCKTTGNTATCKMDVSTYLLGKYMAAAAITTAKPVSSAETYVDISAAGKGGNNWQFKTVDATASGLALADGDFKWYFPKYKKPAKVDAEDSATDGDRLNKGDKLSVFVGGQKTSSSNTANPGAANACGTGIAVDKGAATLAAGSLALAAALAM